MYFLYVTMNSRLLKKNKKTTILYIFELDVTLIQCQNPKINTLVTSFSAFISCKSIKCFALIWLFIYLFIDFIKFPSTKLIWNELFLFLTAVDDRLEQCSTNVLSNQTVKSCLFSGWFPAGFTHVKYLCSLCFSNRGDSFFLCILLSVYAAAHERWPFLALAAAGHHEEGSVSAHGLYLTPVVDFDLKDTQSLRC